MNRYTLTIKEEPMRIYYVMEARGRRCHVLSALGVDVRAWNRLHRRVREWRRPLEQRHGIPANEELRLSDPSCGCGCHTQPPSLQGMHVVFQGLRVVEDFAVEIGGIGVINVCLDKQDVPNYRSVSLNRLYNRVNATAAQERGYAFLIFGQEPEDTVVRTYEQLRIHNPVPVRVGACGDGWHTRNLPIDRIIGGPVFRSPETDCLLQVAGLVAHALLWQEDPPAGADLGEIAGVFAVLDRALNRRASRNDPQGVVRK